MPTTKDALQSVGEHFEAFLTGERYQELLHTAIAGLEDDSWPRDLMAMVVARLLTFNGIQLQRLAQFADVLAHEFNCRDAPAESFIESMLGRHYLLGGLTPEDVADEADPNNPEGFAHNHATLLKARAQLAKVSQYSVPPNSPNS